MTYIVRPMRPDDISRVVKIDRLSFPRPWPPSAYLYELNYREHSYYYVLVNDQLEDLQTDESTLARLWSDLLGPPRKGRVIGYVGLRLRDRGRDGHISTIAIHPDWRGRGLGELLLLSVLEKAIELEVDVVSLEVRETNDVAQRLYEKYHFQFVGVNAGYYHDGEDALLMEVRVDREGYREFLGEACQALEERIGTYLCREEKGSGPEEAVRR